jgi:hypothetical protein
VWWLVVARGAGLPSIMREASSDRPSLSDSGVAIQSRDSVVFLLLADTEHRLCAVLYEE